MPRIPIGKAPWYGDMDVILDGIEGKADAAAEEIGDRLSETSLSATYVSDLTPSTRIVGKQPDMLAPANNPGHGWVNSGSSGTVTLNDTTAPPFGSQAVRMVTAGTGAQTCHVTRSGLALDLTGKHPVLWLKVSGLANLSKIELRLGDATFTNFWYFKAASESSGETTDVGGRFIRDGKPICLKIPWGWQGTDGGNGGSPSRAALSQVRVTVTDNAAGPVTVDLAGFGAQDDGALDYPNGVVSFSFDDGWDSQYTQARPILDKYGWRATALPIVDLIGDGGYMTLAQLRALQDTYGWEVGAHANTVAAHNAVGGHTSLTGVALRAELRENKKWLRDNGFRAHDLYAYPQGAYNDELIDLAGDYFTAVRSQHSFRRDVLPPSDPMRIRTKNLGGTSDTLAQAKVIVDEVAANREWGVFTLHRLVSSVSTGSEWAISDFSALVDYCYAKGVAVLPVGAALAVRRPNAASVVRPGQAMRTSARTGYVTAGASPSTSNTLAAGTLRVAPIDLPDCSITSVGLDVVAAGSAGALMRCVIYADDGSGGYPGALVHESTVAADAIATPENAVNIPVRGGRYWIGAVVQGAPATQPTIRTFTLPLYAIPMPAAATAVQNTILGVGATGITGAAPNPFPATVLNSSSMPRLFLAVKV